MPPTIRQELKQRRAFTSAEQEAMLGIRMAAARILAPWERFLKTEADLTTSQYNVLRILRGAHPTAPVVGCGSASFQAWRNIRRSPQRWRASRFQAKSP